MKGVIFEAANAEAKVVNTLTKPTPAPGQILVKSLWTAMNPVDLFMVYGQLVVEWPLVLGVDASGVIVETTSEAESQYNLKKGDYVCGCTRLGYTQYGTGQEYYLMDAEVTMRKPKNIDLVQAATLGVGMETAGLGLFAGLGCDIPDAADSTVQEKNEWVVVLGGASSVGGYAIQLAKAAGYKVLSSCSARSMDSVKSLGAEVFDYTMSTEEQVETVMKVTGSHVNRVFDAVAGDDPVLARELFKKTKSKEKFFATTNDWSGITDFEGGQAYLVQLGPVGRPEAIKLNKTLSAYIPVFVKLIEAGKVKPGDHSVYGQGGFDDLIGAFKHKTGGSAGSTKVVVKVQDE